MSKKESLPGADPGLTRRDFIDSAGRIAAATLLSTTSGLAAASANTAVATGSPTAEQLRTETYPPLLQGIRGQNQSAMSAAHLIRDGQSLPAGEDSGELYDLVVVGAGMSGLSAAYFYRKTLPSAKILVLDGCDDFGGHARQNEFEVGGKLLIAPGGTSEIQQAGTYTPAGKALLADIGVSEPRYYASTAGDAKRFGGILESAAVFFDAQTYGVDKLVTGFREFMPFLLPIPAGSRTEAWQRFLAHAPLSARTKADLLRIVGASPDYMPGVSVNEKIRRLRAISYADYLTQVVGVGAQTSHFIQKLITGFHLNVGAGPDSFSAWLAYQAGIPGFDGMGLPPLRISEIIPDDQMGDDIYLPGGNALIARLLVRSFIPGALPGSTMEDSITQRLDYSALDLPTNAVRIRLESTVVRVEHTHGPANSSDVTVSYVRDGRVLRVRAKCCVMACYNAMVPHICPELPEPQKRDLKLAVRKPLVWISVALTNWRAFDKLRVGLVYSPGSFYEMTQLDLGTTLGNNYVARSPDDPAIVYLSLAPNAPGLPAREQFRAGRAQLQALDLQTYERIAREQLHRQFAGGGFDPQRDIAGITINRWAHGYACGGNDLYDPPLSETEPPWVRGRRRFGRIAIANSDAAGISLTQAAFDQAHRAVQELLTDVVRPQFYTLNPEQG